MEDRFGEYVVSLNKAFIIIIIIMIIIKVDEKNTVQNFKLPI
jgi:hypothetical protein